MIEAHLVDCRYGRRRIGVRGEQHFSSLRMQLHHLEEELGAHHVGHPLIDEKQRDRRAALFQLTGRLESLRGGPRAHHPIIAPVVVSQIPLDGPKDFLVIVDNKHDGSDHVGGNHRTRRAGDSRCHARPSSSAASSQPKRKTIGPDPCSSAGP
jgi:hypothetical protein